MKNFLSRVSAELAKAVEAGHKEPLIVKKFVDSIATCGGPTESGKVANRSKFIHQRPYAFFVIPPLIEGKTKTELGDILFIVKERIAGEVKRKRISILQVKLADADLRVDIPPHQHTFQRDLYNIAFRFGNRYYLDTWHPRVFSHIDKSSRLMANLILPKHGGHAYVLNADEIEPNSFKFTRETNFLMSTEFPDYFDSLCNFTKRMSRRVGHPPHPYWCSITPVLEHMVDIIYRSTPVGWTTDPEEEWRDYFVETPPDEGFGIVEITVETEAPIPHNHE